MKTKYIIHIWQTNIDNAHSPFSISKYVFKRSIFSTAVFVWPECTIFGRQHVRVDGPPMVKDKTSSTSIPFKKTEKVSFLYYSLHPRNFTYQKWPYLSSRSHRLTKASFWGPPAVSFRGCQICTLDSRRCATSLAAAVTTAWHGWKILHFQEIDLHSLHGKTKPIIFIHQDFR